MEILQLQRNGCNFFKGRQHSIMGGYTVIQMPCKEARVLLEDRERPGDGGSHNPVTSKEAWEALQGAFRLERDSICHFNSNPH